MGQSLEMATVTGVRSGASDLVNQAVSLVHYACVGSGLGAGSKLWGPLTGSLTALGRLRAMVACCLGD